MGRKYAEKPYKFRRNDIVGKALNSMLSDHTSSVCSVCSVVIMTSFTILPFFVNFLQKNG